MLWPMRFEMLAAYGLGVFLPVAEVCRRRTDFSNIPAYLDDFIIGGLLLFAARQTTLGRRGGPVLLVMALAAFCGGMYGSFFGQLTHGSGTDVSGLSDGVVVIVKGILYLIGIMALISSVRAATASMRV